MEVAYHQQMRFLPGPINSLGVHLNYTLMDSEASLPDRTAVGRRSARRSLPPGHAG